MRFHVDPDTLPAWTKRKGKPRPWLVATYLGRPRDPEDARQVRQIYADARRYRRRGCDVVVDHIVPLCSDWVCGLHHSANLRIECRWRNGRKSNGADHPDLFDQWPEPHQRKLL